MPLPEDNEQDRHAKDMLRNISEYHGKCMVCGKQHHETTMSERPDAWFACECGHVIHVFNGMRWH